MKATIYFDWANNMYVNGRLVRKVTDVECLYIGRKLGWYKE